jgi:hypothetical protein
VFDLENELLVERQEAMERMRKLRALVAMCWQSRTRKRTRQVQRPVPPEPKEMMKKPSQNASIPVEDPQTHALDSVLSDTLFHDRDDQPSFDEWMEIGESTE